MHIVVIVRGALLTLAVLYAITAAPMGARSNQPATTVNERNEDACTSANSPQVTIGEVNGNFDFWRDKCVSIDGLLYGHRLYANRESTLGERDMFGEALSKSGVLPFNPTRGFKLPKGRPRNFRVIGRIGGCRDAYAWLDEYHREHPGEIVFLSGLCHMTMENYVVPTKLIDLRDGPAPRLTEAEIPPGKRRLRVVSGAELEVAAPYVDAGQQWLNAFASKDREAALRLEFVEYDEMMQARAIGDPYEGLEDNYRDVKATHDKAVRLLSFAAAFKWVRPPLVLAETIPSEATGQAITSRKESSYTMCWCRGPDCSGKWPIAPWDADNDPLRPYFCLEALDYVLHGKGTKIQVSVPVYDQGFGEPNWPTK